MNPTPSLVIKLLWDYMSNWFCTNSGALFFFFKDIGINLWRYRWKKKRSLEPVSEQNRAFSYTTAKWFYNKQIRSVIEIQLPRFQDISSRNQEFNVWLLLTFYNSAPLWEEWRKERRKEGKKKEERKGERKGGREGEKEEGGKTGKKEGKKMLLILNYPQV